MQQNITLLILGVMVVGIKRVDVKTFFLTPILFLEAYFRDTVGSVPDHHNKVNITIKRVTQIFWFSSVYKSYVYTIL